jgi:hypothetical protein
MKMHWPCLVHGWRRLTVIPCLVVLVVVTTTLPSSCRHHHQSPFVESASFVLPLLKTTCCFKMQERKKKWFLYMGKGFGSARSKQDDLARKLELIKKQRAGNSSDATVDGPAAGESTSPSSPSIKDKAELRLQEERDLFSKLLAKNPPPPPREDERSATAFTRIEPSSVVTQQKQPTFGASTAKMAPKVKAKDLKRKRKASMAEQNAEKTKSKCISHSVLYCHQN